MKMINPPGSRSGSKNRTVWIVVGSSIGGFAVLCLIIFVAAISCKCKKKKLKPGRVENEAWTPLRVNGGSAHSRMSELTLNEYRSLKIPFADIQMATNNFDNSLKIGSGGFGVVFKGVLGDNTKVAVKRGLPGSRQGLPEFQTEIKILSKIRHCHLVSLIGYCEEQSEMILVYEYMEKGPLKKHLDQVNLAEWAMEWQKKGMLEKIVDARLAGQIKKRSLKKFGETAEKCLADYGVDRPSMGDVLWNLECALQLQESDSEPSREPGEDSNANAPELPAHAIAPRDLSDNTGTETDGSDGSSSSEIRNSQVFSQLMNNDGR
ncbi:MALECTIN/RECEPTOR-LIKE KINASE FAMILY PROTEIN [Salix viminalis]|uniref:MALECTIN/RECEPTOR-LIKE KINASE FAMILY PROTEIN n=1 Tax=Salix viminalis TaxID=40686 RepID=A0A9Q0QIS3_SALVM|nr:MALECTIN/RECEPTOR-LIKE KINASE FAMILY PROTEIN [Salix viminalis]